MEKQYTTVDGRQFEFELFSVIDGLKIQQKILRKVNVKGIVSAFNSIDGIDSDGILEAFMAVVSGFDPDELINLMTEIFEKAKAKIQKDSGEIEFFKLNETFKGNFNSSFILIFNILKANYSGFFSQVFSQDQKRSPDLHIQIPMSAKV